jgi:hypothetical protein
MNKPMRWIAMLLPAIFLFVPTAHAQLKPGNPVDYAVDTMEQYIGALKHDDIAGATKLMAPGVDADMVEIYLRGQASLFAQGHTASVVDGWEDGKCAVVLVKRTSGGGAAEYDVACMICVDEQWKVATEIEELATPLSPEQHEALERLKKYALGQIPTTENQ